MELIVRHETLKNYYHKNETLKEMSIPAMLSHYSRKINRIFSVMSTMEAQATTIKLMKNILEK